MINIVIPMAGHGNRFQDTDHKEPKPLIEVVEGKPMIQLAVDCLTPSTDHRFIFICQRDHYEAYQLDDLFGRISNRYEKILVDEVTEGPAASVLLAKEWINNEEPMMTACSDDYVDIDIDAFLAFASEHDSKGTVMTYLGNELEGSSAIINKDGLITEVAEKKIIGPQTTVGIYYFDKGRYYVKAAKQMIRNDHRANGEFYVSPVYNELIAQNDPITSNEIPASAMHTMGTPEGLRIFQRKLQAHPEIIS